MLLLPARSSQLSLFMPFFSSFADSKRGCTYEKIDEVPSLCGDRLMVAMAGDSEIKLNIERRSMVSICLQKVCD